MNSPFPEISIVLPCLNEEPSLASCLDKLKSVIAAQRLSAEVIVVDNGSTDRSPQVAKEKGVILLHEAQQGYGAACLKGLTEAHGQYLVLVDADGSYDFSDIPQFVNQLKEGSDFVIGNRFKGRMMPGAMPWPHRYIGNPVLSGLLRLFFRTKVQDVHCGLRAIRKAAFNILSLRTTGMEFASEMVIKAIKRNLRITEIAIDYHPRAGVSKLKSLADGWRHLRFMLIYSPLFLFFFPGLLLFVLGSVSLGFLYFDVFSINGIRLQYHPMFLSALLIITGYQLIIFALFVKTYAITHLGDKPIFEKLYQYLTIEKASLGGIGLLLGGALIFGEIFWHWISTHGAAMNEVKNLIVALILMVVGIQTVFSAFVLSILGIKEK